MDKGRFLKMAENPDFISGIYNYCDRWCERCAFTRRCLTYATIQDSSLPEGSEKTDETLSESVKESFELAAAVLDDMAKEQGIDLDQAILEENRSKRDGRRKQAQQNPVSRDAREYSKMVREWFEHHPLLFEEKRKRLEEEMILGVGEPLLVVADILDAAEVIQWHRHQIFVKILRALTGMEHEEEMPEVWEECQRDSDGSAKVALLGIDRSITAWGTLMNGLEDESRGITKIIVHLDRLRLTVEEHFPGASSFVRPGFDQEI